MFNLSDAAWQAIQAISVAIVGVIGAIYAKKRSKISDRRQSSNHTLRHDKYVYEHSYHEAVSVLDDIRELAFLIVRLKHAGADYAEELEGILSKFPNNKVPDYARNFRQQLADAERLQQDLKEAKDEEE